MAAPAQQYYFLPDGNDLYVLAMFNSDMSSGLSKFYTVGGAQKRMLQVDKKNAIETSRVFAEPAYAGSLDDLVNLGDLHVATILHTTRQRFAEHLIYTSLGQVLMVVNPFAPLPTPIYGAAIMQQCLAGTHLRPHIYRIALQAFNNLCATARPQSLIISGESGAGKTEATKQCLDMLTFLSPAAASSSSSSSSRNSSTSSSSSSSDVTRKILAASPVLEAFGNAKTLRNNNSSRFGKWMEIAYTWPADTARRRSLPGTSRAEPAPPSSPSSMCISSSSTTAYLLEKSRLVSRDSRERCFHIFYQLLSLPPEALRPLHLSSQDVAAYRYLTARPPVAGAAGPGAAGGGSTGAVGRLKGGFLAQNNNNSSSNNVGGSGASTPSSSRFATPVASPMAQHKQSEAEESIDDAAGLDATRAALSALGLSQGSIFAVVAAVLLLGNVEFAEAAQGCRVDGGAREAVEKVAELLCLDPGTLEFVLCHRVMSTGGGGGGGGEESTTIALTAAQACSTRDSLARSLYEGLFLSLVAQINGAGEGGDRTSGTGAGKGEGSIGILDVFGFESFRENGFEVLCINYANEVLQQHFNYVTFQAEMSAYQAEGIEIDALVSELRAVDVSMWGLGPSSGVGSSSSGAALDVEGLMLLLEEESRVPLGSAKSWYEKAKRSNTNNSTNNNGGSAAGAGAGGVPFPCISFPARKDVFVVKHFAGAVEYTPGLFLEKNTETLSRDARRCIEGSSSAFVQGVFKSPSLSLAASHPPAPGAVAESSQPKSLFRSFRASLAALMQTIRATDSHFVRCVKSNDQSRPRLFDSQCVHKQLLYCGIFDTIKIQQAGLPCRLPHAAFMARYLCTVPSDVRYSCRDPSALLEALRSELGPDPASPWLARLFPALPLELTTARVGKSMVLYKGQEQKQLEDALHATTHRAAVLAGCASRRHVFQSVYRALLRGCSAVHAALARMDLDGGKAALLSLRQVVTRYASLASSGAKKAFAETPRALVRALSRDQPFVDGIYARFEDCRALVERLGSQLGLLEGLRCITAAAARDRAALAASAASDSASSDSDSGSVAEAVTLEQYECLEGLLQSARDLGLPADQFPVVDAASALWGEFCLAQRWVDVYAPRKGGAIPGVSVCLGDGAGGGGGAEGSNGRGRAATSSTSGTALTPANTPLSELSEADIAASIALLLLFPTIPQQKQAVDRARARLHSVQREESGLHAPLLRCLAEEAVVYDEAAHAVRSARQMPRPSSWGAGAERGAEGQGGAAVSVASIVAGVSIEFVVSKQARELFLDARAFLRLRDDLLPAQDGLAVLRFLEATPPRTPQLQAQFAIFRAWANVQLTTVALRECLHQGSIGCTAVPSLITPVRTVRLRALLNDLSLVNSAVCSDESDAASGSQPTSKIRSTVAAAKWVLQLRRLYLAGRWAAMETWCGVAGPAILHCPDAAASAASAARGEQPAPLLPPHMAFSLAEFPAIEVERENALWQCGYHAHVSLLLSHAARPVFSVPVLGVPAVAPELLFACPSAVPADLVDNDDDDDDEVPRAAPPPLTPYPPAFLGISDWTSFSADNVAALAALEQGGAFCRRFPGAVPLLEWCVTALETTVALRACMSRGDPPGSDGRLASIRALLSSRSIAPWLPAPDAAAAAGNATGAPEGSLAQSGGALGPSAGGDEGPGKQSEEAPRNEDTGAARPRATLGGSGLPPPPPLAAAHALLTREAYCVSALLETFRAEKTLLDTLSLDTAHRARPYPYRCNSYTTTVVAGSASFSVATVCAGGPVDMDADSFDYRSHGNGFPRPDAAYPPALAGDARGLHAAMRAVDALVDLYATQPLALIDAPSEAQAQIDTHTHTSTPAPAAASMDLALSDHLQARYRLAACLAQGRGLLSEPYCGLPLPLASAAAGAGAGGVGLSIGEGLVNAEWRTLFDDAHPPSAPSVSSPYADLLDDIRLLRRSLGPARRSSSTAAAGGGGAGGGSPEKARISSPSFASAASPSARASGTGAPGSPCAGPTSGVGAVCHHTVAGTRLVVPAESWEELGVIEVECARRHTLWTLLHTLSGGPRPPDQARRASARPPSASAPAPSPYAGYLRGLPGCDLAVDEGRLAAAIDAFEGLSLTFALPASVAAFSPGLRSGTNSTTGSTNTPTTTNNNNSTSSSGGQASVSPHAHCLWLFAGAYLSLLQAVHYGDWPCVAVLLPTLRPAWAAEQDEDEGQRAGGGVARLFGDAASLTLTEQNTLLNRASQSPALPSPPSSPDPNADSPTTTTTTITPAPVPPTPSLVYPFLPSDLSLHIAQALADISQEHSGVLATAALRSALENLDLPDQSLLSTPSGGFSLDRLALHSTSPESQRSRSRGTISPPGRSRSVYSRSIRTDELQAALDAVNPGHSRSRQLLRLGREVHALLSTLALGGALVVDALTISSVVSEYHALALDCADIGQILNYVRVRQLVRSINDAIGTYTSSERLAAALGEMKASIAHLPRELLPWLSAAQIYCHMLRANEQRNWPAIVEYAQRLEAVLERLTKYQATLRDTENVASFLRSMQRVVGGSYKAALEIKADDARGLAAPRALAASLGAERVAAVAAGVGAGFGAAGAGAGGEGAGPGGPDAPSQADLRSAVTASRRRLLLSQDMASPGGVTKMRLRGCTDEDIWDSRFPLEVLWACDFPARFLCLKHIPAARLKAVGYTAFDLHHAGYPLPALRACGYDASDLRVAGCSIDQLRAAQYSDPEIALGGFSTQSLKTAGLDAARLARRGVALPTLVDMGFTALDLRAAGFDAAVLKAAGFGNVRDLLGAGFSVTRLLQAGFGLPALRQGGVTYLHLRHLDFSVASLMAGGFILEAEEEVLRELFTQCGGDGWKNRRGWKNTEGSSTVREAGQGVRDWFGVTTTHVAAPSAATLLSPKKGATPKPGRGQRDDAPGLEQWELNASSTGFATSASSTNAAGTSSDDNAEAPRYVQRVCAIRLPKNGLRGRLPDSLGLLACLHTLNLEHNDLSGQMPPSLRTLLRAQTGGVTVALGGNAAFILSPADKALIEEAARPSNIHGLGTRETKDTREGREGREGRAGSPQRGGRSTPPPAPLLSTPSQADAATPPSASARRVQFSDSDAPPPPPSLHGRGGSAAALQHAQADDDDDEDEDEEEEEEKAGQRGGLVSVAIAAKDALGRPLRLPLPDLDDAAALCELFRLTNGRAWKHKANWCSALPLDKWFGVKLNRQGRVARLLLPYNNLTSALPACIGCLGMLVELDLRYNQLEAIPESIGALGRVKILHLHCNRFKGVIPTTIAGCRMLEQADFHSNQLSGPVPLEALAQARLTFLNLSSNVWGRHGGKEGVDAVRRGLPNCRAVVM